MENNNIYKKMYLNLFSEVEKVVTKIENNYEKNEILQNLIQAMQNCEEIYMSEQE